MPFTPFHMGPGLAIKAVAGRRFSLMVFGVSQVAIDLEPLVRIYRGDAVLHGWTHTYLGATVIAVISAVIGRPIGARILAALRGALRTLCWEGSSTAPRIGWAVPLVSALVGTWSHVLLDSLMHADMVPWAPFSTANGLLYALPFASVYRGCFWVGVAGLVVLIGVHAWRSRARTIRG
jgi:hypothetical protein